MIYLVKGLRSYSLAKPLLTFIQFHLLIYIVRHWIYQLKLIHCTFFETNLTFTSSHISKLLRLCQCPFSKMSKIFGRFFVRLDF